MDADFAQIEGNENDFVKKLEDAVFEAVRAEAALQGVILERHQIIIVFSAGSIVVTVHFLQGSKLTQPDSVEIAKRLETNSTNTTRIVVDGLVIPVTSAAAAIAVSLLFSLSLPIYHLPSASWLGRESDFSTRDIFWGGSNNH